MTVPFTYPSAPHERRHGPVGYAGYESYRPWLRDEFAFRCVYCLMRETWGSFGSQYAIDHFVPTVTAPEATTHYANLLYACVTCNGVKSDRLVTVFGGSGFVGRHVVRALARDGWRIRVASRRPDLAFYLQPLGKVGQIMPVQANLRFPV